VNQNRKEEEEEKEKKKEGSLKNQYQDNHKYKEKY
jgi:hypothetical protein